MEGDREACLAAGMNPDYLAKLIRPEELSTALLAAPRGARLPVGRPNRPVTARLIPPP